MYTALTAITTKLKLMFPIFIPLTGCRCNVGQAMLILLRGTHIW